MEGQFLSNQLLYSLVQLNIIPNNSNKVGLPVPITHSCKTCIKTCHLLCDKCDCFARASCSGRPPDTVDVVLGVSWNVEVDHDVHVRDVQTPAGHVSSNQYGVTPALELVQCTESLGLAQLAVDGDGTEPQTPQQQCSPEDEGLLIINAL